VSIRSIYCQTAQAHVHGVRRVCRGVQVQRLVDDKRRAFEEAKAREEAEEAAKCVPGGSADLERGKGSPK
jgi:hypothetical protein